MASIFGCFRRPDSFPFFYLGLVELLVAFLGCFVTLVAATSMMVGILVSALVLIDLDAR